MTIVFVSPHADDVCLSIGGVAAATPRPALLATVFTQSNWVDPSWSSDTSPAEIPGLRENEDVTYCERAGLEYVSLGLPDSGVRHDGNGDLRRPSGHETRLRHRVESAIGEIVHRSQAEAVFAPMGLGGHADHVVCRRAVEAACAGLPVAYYEDLPYAYELPMWRVALTARRLIGTLAPIVAEHGLGVAEKAAMMQACYPSQCNTVMFEAIDEHSRRLGARFGSDRPGQLVERLWVRGDPQVFVDLLAPESRLLSTSAIRRSAQ